MEVTTKMSAELSVKISEELGKVVSKFINNFIKQISDKYDIDSDELKSLFNGGKNNSKKKVENKADKNDDVSDKDEEETEKSLKKLNKTELKELCKSRGLKLSGTKNDIIKRLTGKEVVKTKATPKSKKTTPNIVKKLIANIPKIVIRRNSHNNYEHQESGLVFNNKTSHVIGRQNDDGTIDELTEEDINQCNAFKFKYKLPQNLDKLSSNDVKVEELEESDEESDDDEIEDESDIDLEDSDIDIEEELEDDSDDFEIEDITELEDED